MQSALGAACLTGMYSDNYITGLSASVVVVVTAGRAAGAPLHARRGPSSHPAQYSQYLMLAGCWLAPAACWQLAGGLVKGRWQQKVAGSVFV